MFMHVFGPTPIFGTFFLTPHGPLHLHICSLFGWLVASGWCWFVLREKYCWLVAGAWFVLREKYCWLVADMPNEHGVAPFRPPSAQWPALRALKNKGKKKITPPVSCFLCSCDRRCLILSQSPTSPNPQSSSILTR
jgi:hypothetical protein